MVTITCGSSSHSIKKKTHHGPLSHSRSCPFASRMPTKSCAFGWDVTSRPCQNPDFPESCLSGWLRCAAQQSVCWNLEAVGHRDDNCLEVCHKGRAGSKDQEPGHMTAKAMDNSWLTNSIKKGTVWQGTFAVKIEKIETELSEVERVSWQTRRWIPIRVAVVRSSSCW